MGDAAMLCSSADPEKGAPISPSNAMYPIGNIYAIPVWEIDKCS
jgi:hypothetical protein